MTMQCRLSEKKAMSKMGKLFSLDSPVVGFMGKVADLMILNLITLIACIPIITVGASLTAMHYVLLKMVRKEEGYIFRTFIKSFKQNFKQATVCWLVILAFILIFFLDLYIINVSVTEIAGWFTTALYVVGILVLMAIIYVFPVLSRFDNTIRGTFKNSFLMSILGFPKTIAMLIINCIPVLALYISPTTVPFVFLLGITAPAYLCAMLYSSIFKRFEPEDASEDPGDNWVLQAEDTEALSEEHSKQ